MDVRAFKGIDRIILACLFLLLHHGTLLFGQPVPDEDLLAWWPVDGNLRDAVGSAHGQSRNPNFRPGLFGECVSFEGTGNDLITIPASPMQGEGSFTLRMSVRIEERPKGEIYTEEEYVLLSQYDPAIGQGWVLRLGSDLAPAFSCSAADTNWSVQAQVTGSELEKGLRTIALIPMPMKRWMDLAIVFDQESLVCRMYLNGHLAGQAQGRCFWPEAPLVLGGAGWPPYPGSARVQIDELKLFGRALAEDEIQRALWPPEVIRIASEEEVENKRTALRKAVWGTPDLPTRWDIETRVVEGAWPFDTLRYDPVLNPTGVLEKFEEWIVPLYFGMTSTVYYLQPRKPNGVLMIYHAGHTVGPFAEDFYINGAGQWTGLVIPALLREGYGVLAIGMPAFGRGLKGQLMGEAEESIATLPGGEQRQIRTHEDVFRYLPLPFRFFLDPVAVGLNYVQHAGLPYSRFFMTGLSGGGWTTTVYAALDPRIERSIPVAGSVPNYLRIGFEGLGDSEQDDFEFYQTANYSELYVLGAVGVTPYGAPRSQLQILNLYDNCCFFGRRHEAWVPAAQEAVRQVGSGRFDFLLDETQHGHRISATALRWILGGPVARWNADDGLAEPGGFGLLEAPNGVEEAPVGFKGGAWALNGIDQSIRASPVPLAGVGRFSIEAMICLLETPSGPVFSTEEQFLLSHYNHDPAPAGWIVRIGQDLRPVLSVASATGSVRHLPSEIQIPQGRWTQLTLSVDEDLAILYVNGRFAGSVALDGFRPSDGPLAFGGPSWESSYGYAHVLIDEVTFYARPLQPDEITPFGLIHYWSADGTEIDAIRPHAVWSERAMAYDTGYIGRSFRFDGAAEQCVSFPVIEGDEEQFVPPVFSAECRFYLEEKPAGPALSDGEQVMLSKFQEAEDPAGWAVSIGSELRPVLRIAGKDGQVRVLASQRPIRLQSWVHIVFLVDETKVSFFVNGEKQDELPYAGFKPALQLLTLGGASWQKSYRCFTGRLDEIRFYDRLLLPEEIQPELVARWSGESGGRDLVAGLHGLTGRGSAYVRDVPPALRDVARRSFALNLGQDRSQTIRVEDRDQPSLLNPSVFQVEGWFKLLDQPATPAGESGEFVLMSKLSKGSAFGGWMLRVGNDLVPTVTISFSPIESVHLRARQPLPLGVWRKIVFSYDGHEVKIHLLDETGHLVLNSFNSVEFPGRIPEHQAPLIIGGIDSAWGTLRGYTTGIEIYSGVKRVPKASGRF